MIKIKRALAILLVLAMIVCLAFSGCEELDENSEFKEEYPPRQTVAVSESDNDGATDDKTTQNSVSLQTGSVSTENLKEDTVGEAETNGGELSTNLDGTEPSLDVDEDFSADPDGIPAYSGTPYVNLNGGEPQFTEEEITDKSYEFYSELDSLGRCGYTIACIGKDIMPTEDRESISSVKPSGWINKAYDSSLVDGRYIYNRCHLIGFQLTGENANKQNLITGTRYMNVDGMLPFENMVADYVKETNNHVMYRVTPIYVGDNLVASGVQMEAFSVEDNGEGICFNVYVYNVQPGITINYATGDNWLTGGEIPETEPETEAWDGKYILNINTKKIHKSTCSGAQDIKSENRQDYEGSLDELIADGYTGCGTCKPIK